MAGINPDQPGPMQGHRRSFPNIQTSTGNGNLIPRARYGDLSPQSAYPSIGGTQQNAGHHGLGCAQNWQSESLEFHQLDSHQQSLSANIDIGELQQFIHPTNKEPWSVPNSTQGYSRFGNASPHSNPNLWASDSTSRKAFTVANGQDAQNYPRPALPSQQSFPASVDSGFVSRLSGPQEYPAIPETTRIPAGEPHIGSFGNGTASDVPQRPASVKSESHLQVPSQTKKGRRPKATVDPCQFCGKVLKNASDAYKHHLQHTKPYKCDLFGCSRKEGFATPNDRERHMKSVHGKRPSVGKEDGYICTACPPASPGARPKWWPRLDNFRAHIGRKHKDWIMSELIQASEHPRPDEHDVASESGYASQPPPSQAPEDQGYQNELSSPMGPPMSRQSSHQGDMGIFHFDQGNYDALAGIGGGGSMAEQYSGAGESNSIHFQGPNFGNGGNATHIFQQPAAPMTSPVDSMYASPLGNHHRIPSITMNQYRFQEQQPHFNHVQTDDRPVKRQKTCHSSEPQDGLDCFRTNDGEFICKTCGKKRRRECDLRKHMKRHTRPYGCTFQGCFKKFGSRNDWKRHENSQHFLQESWRCELRRPDGSKCGKLLYHEDIFANHLGKKHNVPPGSQDNKTLCIQMHLGREGHYHFWCGFCNGLIQQADSMQESAWDRRFKHIGDHFDKENYHIDNWVDIEQNRAKGLITKEDRKKAKHQTRNGHIDEDSDLGDDGIPSLGGRPTGPPNPMLNVPQSYQSGLDPQASTYTSKKRRSSEMEVDADGVSDSGW